MRIRSHCAMALLFAMAVCPACDDKGDDAPSTDTRQAVDLSETELSALCQRTNPYRQRALSDEKYCTEQALREATDFGDALFDKAVCVAERDRCLKDAASEMDIDEFEELPCGHLDWFGSQKRPTCDVTVAEFENCWKRMADAVVALKCEAGAQEAYWERRGDCFGTMEFKCEPD